MVKALGTKGPVLARHCGAGFLPPRKLFGTPLLVDTRLSQVWAAAELKCKLLNLKHLAIHLEDFFFSACLHVCIFKRTFQMPGSFKKNLSESSAELLHDKLYKKKVSTFSVIAESQW